MPDVTPEYTPEAGTPEAEAAARVAQASPPNRSSAFVAVFGITALTVAFFLAIFFVFPGLDGGSSTKAAQVDSVRTSLRAQDSLDVVALHRYNAVRDTAGAVQAYTMPIDSAMMQEAKASGRPVSADSVMPLR